MAIAQVAEGSARRTRGRRLAPSAGQTCAIAYLRLSKEEEATGNGLDGQRLAIERACKASGYAEVEWIVDDGYSAKDTNRPGLTDALAKVETGAADLLIAAKLDRVARNTLDFLSLVARAQTEGWKIRVLDGDFDMTTPEGEMQITMLAAFATFERRRIGQRQRVSVEVKKANGTYKGTYRTAPQIRDRILKMRADGLSNNRIADTLNSEGILSPGGSAWCRKTVWGLSHDSYRSQNETGPRNETGVR